MLMYQPAVMQGPWSVGQCEKMKFSKTYSPQVIVGACKGINISHNYDIFIFAVRKEIPKLFILWIGFKFLK